MLSLSLGFVLRLGALHDERDVLILLTYVAKQSESSVLHFLTVARELRVGGDRKAAVGYHAKHVLLVFVKESHSLIIVSCQYHLWSATHSQCRSVRIKCLCGKALALCEDKGIEIRQERGIESDAVLHEHDDLHAGFGDVMVEIHLVLDKLDDGENEVSVSEPAEYVVEDGEVLMLHTSGDTVAERCQHHAWQVREVRLDSSCHVEGVIVGITRHTDDEVDVHRSDDSACLFRRADLRESRWIAQTELSIFIEYLAFYSSVVLQHEGIIGICYDEDSEYTLSHQILEGDVA